MLTIVMSPHDVQDSGRMLRVASLLRRIMSVLCAVTRSLPLSIVPPIPGIGCRVSDKSRPTMTSRKRHLLPGVLFAVALALLAGIAQAQLHQKPALDPDAVSLSPPENFRSAHVGESFSLTLPEATGDIAFFRSAYTLSPLPPGMDFDAGSRRLYGTPTEVGTTRLTYRVEAGFPRLRFYATTTFDLEVRSGAKVSALNRLGTDSLYTWGEVIQMEIIFALPVTVRGSPILELGLDSGTVQMRHANPTSATTSRLLFNYTIQSGDETDGISIGANALRLNGGSITDETGNPADLSLVEHFFFHDPRYNVDGRVRVTNLAFTTRAPTHLADSVPASYLADEDIKVRVDFGQPVTVTGSPSLRLDIGTRRVRARYDARVHNTNNRSVGFVYNVQPGDLDEDGISIAADALASVGTDTITDAAGNPTDDSSLAEHAIRNDPAQMVDAVRPRVAEVNIISRPANGDTYREGETIQLRVAFDEALLAFPGTFQAFQPITLSSGRVMAEGMRNPQTHTYNNAEYHTITEVIFHYTVQADDYDADGISYFGTPRGGGNIFSVGRARYYDITTNSLLTDITDLIITNDGMHKVDGGGPRVTRLQIASRPDKYHTYLEGEEIKITLTFNQLLVGDLDNLRLTLNLDSGAVVSQSTSVASFGGRGIVGFTFIVQNGDLDEDGISIGADALSLTSGSVTNRAGKSLILTLAEHTVTNNPSHKVDATPPGVTNVTFTTRPPTRLADSAPRSYPAAEDIKVRVDFGQPVTITGLPGLRLDMGARRVMAHYDAREHRADNRSVGFIYSVQPGDLDEDGISIAADALASVGTDTITDAVGHPTDATSLADHVIRNDPAQTVDAVRPRVTEVSIISSPAYGDTYLEGETIQLRVAFSEDLLIHPPAFQAFQPITLGSGQVRAEGMISPQAHTYNNAEYHTITEVVFHYTVQADDYDADGISYFGTPQSGSNSFSVGTTRYYDATGNVLFRDITDLIITNDGMHKVEGGGPRVANLGIVSRPATGDTYLGGEEIRVTLTFSQRLVGDVDNLQMTLNLDSGAAVSQSPRVSIFNSRGIVAFSYIVQDGDLNEDGVSIGADALSLTSGSVTNQAGRPLILSLAEHTITNHPDHKVDAVAPKVTDLRIISTPAQGEVYGLGEMIRVRLTLDQPVTPSGSPILSVPLLIGDATRELIFDKFRSPVSVIEAAYQVQDGDLDEDGISIGEGGLKVTGGSLTDAAGNPLRLSLEGHTITNAPAHQVSAMPRFMDVDSVPDQTYTVGQSVSLALPQAIGGVAPLRYDLTGNIPSGLVFDANTRTLSGTPSAPMAATELRLMVTDTVPSAAFLTPFHVTVVAAPSFGDARIDDQIYTVTKTIPRLILPEATSALDLTYSLAPLPAGLAFDPATRTLSGTPTTPAAITELELTATDINGISTPLGFLVTIAERPTFGDTSITDLTLTEGMPPIDILLPAATGVAPLIYILGAPNPDALEPIGLSFGQTTRRLTGAPIRTTEIAMTYTAVDNNAAVATTPLTFSLSVAPPLRFVPSTIPDQTFTVGRPVLLTLSDTSGGYGDKQYTLNEDALPGWLGYDRTTHTLSGTPPAVAEAIPLRWQVRDVNRAMDTLEFSISVVEPPSFAGIRVDDQIYTATAAIPGLALPAPQHGAMPLSYTLLPVPAGLAVNRATRTLSGTPSTPAAATELEWSATDSNGASDSLRFQVRVAKPPRFVAEVEDMLIRASRYTEPMILPLAEHGHGDLTYNLQEKRGEQIRELPENVRFDPASRELSIRLRLGVYVLVYTATDANGAVASQEFTVEATSPQFAGARFYTFDRGVPITPVVLPLATGGIGELTYAFQAPSHGISYDATTRTLFGTPTTTTADHPGAYLSYLYTAEDEVGGGGIMAIRVRVRENGGFPPYVPMYFDPPLSGDLLITRGIAFELILPPPQGGTGANPAFNYSTHFESLPPGIQFDRNTRRLHGSAVQVTTGRGYSFRYTVSDLGTGALSERINAYLTIKVVQPPSFAEPLRLSLRQNELLPVAPIGPIKLPAARDGAPPIVYTLEGDLPPGLAFDPGSRALSGRPTEDGVSTLTYTATDANGASVSGDFVFTVVDTVAPEVTGVSIISTPNQGDIYLLGEQIRMRLDFNEPVMADVSPKPILSLNLRIGTETTAMSFPFPADSNEPIMSVEGSYTVQEGDLDENGVSNTHALFIAGLHTDLTDAAGNSLFLGGIANPDQPKHKVDGVVPKVSFVLVTPSPDNHNTYALGEEIKVVLAFDSHLPVLQGQLSMQYTLDSGLVTARNSRKHGIAGHGLALNFSYVVQSGDLDKNGFSLGANALRLVPEESVTDESGNPVNLSLADFAFTDDPDYQVDGVGPEVTAVTITSTPRLFGHYRTGERITLRVDFDESVTIIDDAPVLHMSLGDDNRRVAMEYTALQPDDTSLLFGYTVQTGDEDNNGVGIGADALRVTSGMVTDIVGNPADLSLTAQAFSNDPLHKVDGVGPRVTGVRILSPQDDNPDPNTFKLGDYIRVLVILDSDPHGDATALRLVLGMDSGEVILQGRVSLLSLNTPRQILFRHTVQLGDLDENGVSIGTDALSLVDGGSVTDELDNPADLSLAHVAFTDDPTRKVDGVPPDLVAPAAQTFEPTGVQTALDSSDYGSATPTDDTATITDDAPDVFPLGDTIITWTATDPAGNEVTATQVVTVVDATPPEVTGVSIISTPNDHKYYGLGDEIEVEVLFSESIGGDKENLSLTLTLASGPVIAQNKVQENDSRALFTYTVQAGDAGSTGISIGANALSLTSGSLADAVGNAANLDLTQFAFENDSEHRVDGVVPEVKSATITSRPQDGDTYLAGEQIVVTVVFTEPVLHGDVHDLRLKLNLGGTEVITPADGRLGLSTFKIIYYTVQNGDYDPNGISFSALHLVEGGSAADPADNPLTLVFPASAAVADQPEHKVDAVAPQVTAVTITSTPRLFGYYHIGERITLRVDFNEPVTVVDDAPVLWLSLGDDDSRVAMEYAAVQPDDTSLLFGYTVQAGDEDNNGVGIGADALMVTSGMVTDSIGNPANLSLTEYAISDDPLHKVDGVPPDIAAPAAQTFEATATLTPLGRAEYGIATSTDGDITDDAPEDFPVGDTIITWTATDTNDLISTAEQTIRIADTTKPDITAPANVSTEATGPTTSVTVGQAAATDLADNALKITRSPETNDFAVGEHTITWKATDASGNEETDTQAIAIADTTAPEITLTGAEEQTIEFGEGYAELKATATDLVDGDLTGSIAIAGTVNTDRVGDYSVTYDVSDAAGNAAVRKTRRVIVEDTMKPGITVPELYTTEATATLTPLGRAEYGIATSTDGDITDDAPEDFPVGDTIITWTATDTNDLISTAEQTIRIIDTTDPMITAPADVSTEATGPTTPVTVGQAAATDLADNALKITRSPETNNFAVGEHTITWKATDASGNEETDTQAITIADTTAPEITLTGAEEQTIEFGEGYAELKATATDLVDGDLTGSIAIAGTVDTSAVGQYTVTYDVSDAAGNAAVRKTRRVIVEDTMKPGITVPELYTTEATATLTPLGRAEYGIATSTDGDITDDAPEDFPVGDTIITWTATDTNDLISTAEQTIRIADTTKPVITAPANVSTEATGPTTPVTVGQAAATDLADNALKITRSPETNNFAVGEHTITWKATDASGNEETDTQTITIADTTAPEITLTGTNPQTIEFGEGYAELKATATDLVDGDLTGSIAIAGTVNTSAVGQYTVTYDVSDAAGNAAVRKTRRVIVEDTMKPGITVPELYTTEATATLTPLGRAEYGIATSTDGDITDDAPEDFPVGDTIITWTATDTNDLISTAEQTIRIADTTKPDITAPANVSTEATGPTTSVTVGQAAATDLADNALKITRSPETNDFAVGEHTITWKATDASGNEETDTQAIAIADTTAPEITLTGAEEQTIEFGEGYAELKATATDLVDGDLTGSIAIAGTVNTDRVGDYSVTYDVSDAAGNAAERKTRRVIVEDTMKPGITVPELYTTEATATLTPLGRAEYGIATSTDGDITDDAPEDFPVGDTIITWTATDTNDLISTAEQTIRIIDTTDPMITAPADVSTEATGPTTPVTVGQAAATDLADNALKITRSPETNNFAVGEHAITWKATDASGNEETDTQAITIADTTAPEITLTGAEEQTIEFGEGYAELKATATDLVDGDLTGSIAIAGTVDTSAVGQYTVTYDVSDAAGNAAVRKTRRVIVEDTMKPGITVPELYTTEATATLTPLGRAEYGIATSTDGDITDDAPEDFPVGDTIITWTATDANNLTSAAEQTIRITDATKPDITAPANVSKEATGPTTPVDAGQATATDLADQAPGITRSPETNDFAVGNHVITWKATDASGNEATAEQTITITDNIAPVITLLKDTVDDNRVALGTAYTEHGATATDLVDDDSELTGRIAIDSTNVDTDRGGVYTITYDVSDAKGNAAATVTRTVRVIVIAARIAPDSIPPTIIAPADVVSEATGPTTPVDVGQATATDLTDPAPDITRSPETNDFAVGNHVITWKATDASGNEATDEQTIRIADTTKPVITAPANVSTEATGPTTPVTVGQAAATDLADNALKITRSPETNNFAVGEHTITWKATDASGNEETDTQTITIADTTAPEITLTGTNPQTIEFGEGYAELKATAIDLVDGDLTGSIAIAGTVDTSAVGQYTVTYDVSDAAGNAAVRKTRRVIVEDTMKPGITVPEPYATEATATLTPLGRAEYGIATSTDGDITDDAPEDFPVGDTIITWTATDANDLISTAEQTITITDTTKPDITAPANVSTEATGPTTSVTVGQAAATDLADQAPEVTRSPETNDFAVGEHAITWKATDASGNEETDTQTITIADTTAPEITLTGAEEQTIEFGDGYAELKATATDLVDGDLTGSIAIAGTVNTDRVGQYTVTYDVSDTAGNAAVRKTRTVIVEDTMKPGITVPEPYATEATATLTPLGRDEYGIATSTDGDITDDAPATFPVGDTIITWTATDANDLISTAEQTITIADTTKPDITAPANVSTEATGPTTSVTVGQAAATDLADQAPEVTRSPETNNFAVGEHAITWKATDASGNEETDTQTIAIADTTAPEITLTGAEEQTIEFGDGYAELKATATDLVDGDLTGSIAIAGTVNTDRVGQYTVTYDVSDTAGNAAVQKTRTVIVEDTMKPGITAPGLYTTEATATLTPLGRDEYGIATSTDGDITDDAPATFPVGDTIITWTATDSNHLSSSAEQTITVVDTTKPIITLLKDTTDDNTVELGTAYTEHRATATDLMDDDSTLTGRIDINSDNVDTSTVGTYTVTYDVSDTNGNPAEQKTRRVMVTAARIAPDNIPPTIIAPADVVSEATGPTTPIDVGQATATDLTDPAPDITRSPETNNFAVGNHIITWKATDASGNEATDEQTIRIIDTTKPVITLLKDTVDDNPVERGTTYAEHGATATDLVDDDTELTGRIAIDSSAVNINRVGDYSVTYDVSDAKGNAADTVTRTVRVTDTTAPDITAPAAYTTEATAPRTPLDSSDYGTATSSDPEAEITSNAPATFPVGTTTIIWAATDTSGNQLTATQIITVVDTTKPIITLLGANPQIVEFSTEYTELGVRATDLVDDDTELTRRIVIAGIVNTAQVGTYEVICDVSDTAGNPADTVTRRVIVEDTIPPDIVAPLAQTFEATAIMTPLDRSDYGTATSTEDTAVITNNAAETFPMGETMITWTATDANELSSSAQQMITVMDTTPPNITLLGDNPLTLEVGGRYIEPGATAVDDMAGDLTDSIVIDATDLDTNQVGTHTVTYTVADPMGNEAQESRSVRVLAGPDFADLNRMILSEVARAMADQNVHAIAQRLKQAGGKTARIASLGGQSSLEGIIAAQGQAISDDQFNIKRFLADSDFVLPLGISEDASDGASDNTSEGVSEEASRLTFWGSGDYRSISDSDQLTWDGDLFSLHLGLDTQVGANLIAGVSLSWNQVALDYSNYTSTQTPDRAGRTATSGDYALEMASIHPYVGWNLGRLDLWATLGYGEGELDITDDEAPLARHLSSDLNLQTLALGASGPLLAADNLRVKAEALRTELEVVGNEQLAALSLDVSRLRMTLEATGNWSLDSGAQLDLILEGGLRYDGGAGKTGSGTEMGGGLRYVHAAKDLTLEAKARSLANYKGGIEEWGLSGLIKFQGSADGRGPFFSLMPAYGEATSSNLQQLWRQGLRLEDGDTERPDYAPSLDLRFGYGMTAPGGRGLLTPYSEMTFGDSSDTYRLGLIWQFNPLDVKLVTERREGLDATAHDILLEGTITF